MARMEVIPSAGVIVTKISRRNLLMLLHWNDPEHAIVNGDCWIVTPPSEEQIEEAEANDEDPVGNGLPMFGWRQMITLEPDEEHYKDREAGVFDADSEEAVTHMEARLRGEL